MLAAVLGWVLPRQNNPSLLHKQPKGRFGLHAIVYQSLTILSIEMEKEQRLKALAGT